MARTPSSYNRKKPHLKPQPTVLVICEDSQSGRQYLKDASIHFRVHLKVVVSHLGHTDPKGIIEQALAHQANFDRVYCVIDRDDHDSFAEAIILAKTSNKITVIASFPCYEFWLLLHFKTTRKPYRAVGSKSSAYLLIRDLCEFPDMADYEKSTKQNIFGLLLGERFISARKAAVKIYAQAIADGELNPSTQIHLLIDDFEKLSKPQPL